jgi:hypothetical protein
MPVRKQGFACIQGILGCRQCGSDAVQKYSNYNERSHSASPKRKGKHQRPYWGEDVSPVGKVKITPKRLTGCLI